MNLLSTENCFSNEPVNLAEFDIIPSVRFGNGDSAVKEVLPKPQPGENLQQLPEPRYLLKRGFGDSISERLSYLTACKLNIPYQTVQWVINPLPTKQTLNSSQNKTEPELPQIAISFEQGAEIVTEIDPETGTATLYESEEIVPIHNPWDAYRIIALGHFIEDSEPGMILRRPDGLIFGIDLTYGFGVSDILMEIFNMPLPSAIRKVIPPNLGINSTGLTPEEAKESIESFFKSLPSLEARKVYLSTFHQAAALNDLPALLATDLKQSPYPQVSSYAKSISNWIRRRQKAIAAALSEIE